MSVPAVVSILGGCVIVYFSVSTVFSYTGFLAHQRVGLGTLRCLGVTICYDAILVQTAFLTTLKET